MGTARNEVTTRVEAELWIVFEREIGAIWVRLKEERDKFYKFETNRKTASPICLGHH